MPIVNPTTTARGLDHLVVAVRDLDDAARRWERLGFQVGAENRHPFGTKNRLIQLPGFFIELLAIGSHAPVTEPHGRVFSFAAYNRDFLGRNGEGPSMLVLESRDARADSDAYRVAGIGDFEPFFFERRGQRPDGSEIHVAFTLAFARNEAAPEAGFFVCQQHVPENFWNPAFQSHPNGAAAVEAVVMTAENPSDHHEFLTHFTGQRDMVSTSSGVTFDLPRGSVEVLSPVAFRARTGVAVDEAARLRALRLSVRDLDAAAALLKAAGVATREAGGPLVVGPDAASGVTLILEQASSPATL